ncbi:MAG: hypothetical protein ABIW85_02560 [Variovorax sp.]
MNLSDITQRFESSLGGTDAFKELYKGAYALMKSDPENAAVYFVLANAAQAFVLQYEDQGISGEFVDRAKAVMAEFNRKALDAVNANPEKRFHMLSEIAYDYEWNTPDF